MRFTLRKSLVPALLVGAVGLATPALAQLLGGGQLGGSVGGVTGNADMTGELSRQIENGHLGDECDRDASRSKFHHSLEWLDFRKRQCEHLGRGIS
jgi:hypothetical protein